MVILYEWVLEWTLKVEAPVAGGEEISRAPTGALSPNPLVLLSRRSSWHSASHVTMHSALVSTL